MCPSCATRGLFCRGKSAGIQPLVANRPQTYRNNKYKSNVKICWINFAISVGHRHDSGWTAAAVPMRAGGPRRTVLTGLWGLGVTEEHLGRSWSHIW